jgi:hypothetical protein
MTERGSQYTWVNLSSEKKVPSLRLVGVVGRGL